MTIDFWISWICSQRINLKDFSYIFTAPAVIWLGNEHRKSVVIMSKIKNSGTGPCLFGGQSRSEGTIHFGCTELHRLFHDTSANNLNHFPQLSRCLPKCQGHSQRNSRRCLSKLWLVLSYISLSFALGVLQLLVSPAVHLLTWSNTQTIV